MLSYPQDLLHPPGILQKKAAECHFLEVSNESKRLSSEKNHKYLTNILKGNSACATSLRGRGCKPCQLRFVGSPMTIYMAFITSFSWWAISLRCGKYMDFGPNDLFNRNLLSRSWNETGLFFRILAASEVQNLLFWRSRGLRKSNTVSRNCVPFFPLNRRCQPNIGHFRFAGKKISRTTNLRLQSSFSDNHKITGHRCVLVVLIDYIYIYIYIIYINVIPR